MPDTLLPASATPLEVALDQATARLGPVPVPIERLWRPEDCPEDLLPWLAWATSVDEWSDDWPETVRRRVIADSYEIHRRKGTPGAIKRGLRSIGYGGADIVEGFSPLAHDGEAIRDGRETYAGARRWALFDVALDLGDWRGFDADAHREVLRQIGLWKNVRSHLRSLSAILRLHSLRGAGDDPTATYVWFVGLALFSSPGPRDGRFMRGTAGLRYRHDAVWGYDDTPPRDGRRTGAAAPLLFGGERDPITLVPDLVLASERTRTIRHDWRVRRGQGIPRGHTDAFEIAVNRIAWALADEARGLLWHDGAHLYSGPVHRGRPGPPSAERTVSVTRFGGDVFRRGLKRPGPGAFRDGTWMFGGAGAPAPSPPSPPVERTRTAVFPFVSTLAPIPRDGSRRYTDGSGVWRSPRRAPSTATRLTIMTQAQRGAPGLTRAPRLTHDGTAVRTGATRRTRLVRYGPVRWSPDEDRTA